MIVDFNNNKITTGAEQVTTGLESLSVHDAPSATVKVVRDSDTESTLSTDSGIRKDYDDLAAESICSCHACEAHLAGGPPPPPSSRAPFRGPPPFADMPPWAMPGIHSGPTDMGFMGFPPPPPPSGRRGHSRVHHDGPHHGPGGHHHHHGKYEGGGRGRAGWFRMFGFGMPPHPPKGEFHPCHGHPWQWEAERRHRDDNGQDFPFPALEPRGHHGHRGHGRHPKPPPPHGPPPTFTDAPEHHGHHGKHGHRHGHGPHHDPHHGRGPVPPPGPARHVRGDENDLIDIFPPNGGMTSLRFAM